jgi:hypothetical protein
MKINTTKNNLFALLFIMSCAFNYAQTNHKLNLEFPADAKLSPRFQSAVDNQKKQFDKLMGWNAEVKAYKPVFMLDMIDNSPEYNYLYIAEYWIAYNYQAMIPELIKRITNNTEIGLVETGDLVIPDRVVAGQMPYLGDGNVSQDDLFTVAGRANRLLTVITGENFGTVSMNTSPFELKKLQDKWIIWFNKL